MIFKSGPLLQRGIDKRPYDTMISDSETTEVGFKVNTKYINNNVLIRFEVLNIKKHRHCTKIFSRYSFVTSKSTLEMETRKMHIVFDQGTSQRPTQTLGNKFGHFQSL